MKTLKPTSQRYPSMLDFVLASAKWISLEDLFTRDPETNWHDKMRSWKTDRTVLIITRQGVDYFLADSFENGELSSWNAALMQVFKHKSDLAIAAWLVSSNSWLRNAKPIDKLKSDFNAVLNAATQESNGIQHG